MIIQIQNINFMQTEKQSHKMKNAFTLLETLLYFALVGIIMVSIATFLSAIIATESKNEAIFEVDQQAQFAIQRMVDTIRNAESINSPALGTNNSSISLQMAAAGNNPTILSANGTSIEITEGSSAAVPLTTDAVDVTGLTFYNATDAGSPEAEVVRIEFTLSYNNNLNSGENDFTQTYYATATLRE